MLSPAPKFAAVVVTRIARFVPAVTESAPDVRVWRSTLLLTACSIFVPPPPTVVSVQKVANAPFGSEAIADEDLSPGTAVTRLTSPPMATPLLL